MQQAPESSDDRPQTLVASTGTATGVSKSGRRRLAAPRTLLGVAVFLVHAVSPTPQTGDSRLSAIVSWQFFRNFNLHIEQYAVVQSLSYRSDLVSVSGHELPFFPWPTMLLAAPASFLLALFGKSPEKLSISDPMQVWIVEVPTASLIVALTSMVIYTIVRDTSRSWATPRVAMVTALVFGFGTSAWSIASRALWQQTASMLSLALVILFAMRLSRGANQAVLLGVFLSLAVIFRPTNVVTVALVGIWLCLRFPRRIGLTAVGSAIPLLPFFLISLREYGELLPPYYLPSRMSEQANFGFWESVAMNLVSPSRGLVIFDPVLIVAVIGFVVLRRRRELTGLDVVMALACCGQLIVISSYGSTGGSTYGPRLMIDVLPYLMLLAAPAIGVLVHKRARRSNGVRVAASAVVVVLAWGLFVNATGAAFRAGFCWSATPVHVDSQPERVWDWSDPQFLRPYSDLAGGRPLRDVAIGSCG